MSEKKFINVAGLYFTKDQGAKSGIIATGNLGGARVLLQKNKFKKKDTHPDLQIVFTEKEKKEDTSFGYGLNKETQEEPQPW